MTTKYYEQALAMKEDPDFCPARVAYGDRVFNDIENEERACEICNQADCFIRCFYLFDDDAACTNNDCSKNSRLYIEKYEKLLKFKDVLDGNV